MIECNLRASRSLPFVSKALRQDFMSFAAQVLLEAVPAPDILKGFNPIELNHVAVKAPMFSLRRIAGADLILGVEMTATGEAGGFGHTRQEALAKALLATGFRFPRRSVLLSFGQLDELKAIVGDIEVLCQRGLVLYATGATAGILRSLGISCESVYDGKEATASRVLTLLRAGEIDLVLSVPSCHREDGLYEGFEIRRTAVDLDIPLVTDLRLASAVLQMLATTSRLDLKACAWHEYGEGNFSGNSGR